MEPYLAGPFLMNEGKRAVTEWKYGDKRSFYKFHNAYGLKDMLNRLKLHNLDNYPSKYSSSDKFHRRL
jgi:hypothetical protein